ncbi:MAG: hypothetical protein IMW89_18675, partial [Ktedonobacteraceae bacterium]|nr:hypothetical protein [Ktedonobacteraceae bacterium]
AIAALRMTTGVVGGGVIGGTAVAMVSLLIPGVGPALAGGMLMAVSGGAVLGALAGGLVGTFTALGVPEDEARFYQAELEKGKTLVTVRAGERSPEAIAILRRGGAYSADNRLNLIADMLEQNQQAGPEPVKTSTSTSKTSAVEKVSDLFSTTKSKIIAVQQRLVASVRRLSASNPSASTGETSPSTAFADVPTSEIATVKPEQTHATLSEPEAIGPSSKPADYEEPREEAAAVEQANEPEELSASKSGREHADHSPQESVATSEPVDSDGNAPTAHLPRATTAREE